MERRGKNAHLEMTAQKRFDDVARGLINSFRKFGGVPKELLFDNMATVSNTNVTPKKPTDSIMHMAKDWGLDGQKEVIHSKNSNEPDRSISLTAELPFDSANLFFNLIAKRYEKLSTIITTNSPFSKWSDIFQEPVLTNALLDRLLHHCSVININGPSYRLKDQMQYMIEEN